MSSPILQLIRRVVEDHQTRESSDQDLLRRFSAQRKETAFHTLLRRHGSMVLDVCRGVLGDGPDAEDAFQVTFLLLAEKAGSIRKMASVGSWLYGVAYRTALKARAQAAVRRKHEACAPERQSSERDEVSWREVREMLHEELSGLPQRYREPLVLCYLEGATQKCAAAQMGLAERTLRARLERGRELLRARLVRRGLAPAALLVVAAWPPGKTLASVPAALIGSTVKAATVVAAGGAASSVVSAKVAGLMKGVTTATLLSKLKMASVVLLALAVVASLRGVPNHQPVGAKPPQEKEESRLKPAANGQNRARARVAWKLRTTIPMPGGDQTPGMALSTDARRIATAHWREARLWDAATGKELTTLQFPGRTLTGPGRGIAFSRDDKLAAVDHKDVKLWDASTGKELGTLSGHKTGVSCIAFSPDGKQLATGSNVESRSVRVWDVAQRKELPIELKVADPPMSLAFSPDGKTLAAGLFEGGVKLWDVATGKALAGWKGHQDWVMSLAFSPNGKVLASGCADGTAKLWDAATGKQLANWQPHTEQTRLTFSPDGKALVTGGGYRDKTVKLWGITDTATVERIQTIEDHTSTVWSVAFARNGRTLVTAGDDAVRIWEAEKK